MLSAGLQQILFGSTFYPGATVALEFTTGRGRVPGISNFTPDISSLPGFSSTRATPAASYAQTSAGLLVPFAANIPRQVDQGLLVEEARTNGIRNNQMSGAVAGVIGSGGALPTNWVKDNDAGLTYTISLGTDSITGNPYIQIRFAGTTASTFTNIIYEANSQIAAATAQSWTSSQWVAMVAGSLTNITGVYSSIYERTAAGAYVAGGNDAALTPSATMMRRTATRTLNGGATVAFTNSGISLTYSSGVAIDITLRIALPQEEQGAFVTSPIPTTSASVTRAADVVSIGGLSLASDWSQVVMFNGPQLSSSNFPAVVAMDDGSANNQIVVFVDGATGRLSANIRSGGVSIFNTNLDTTALTAGTPYKFALVKSGATLTAYRNGTLISTISTGFTTPAVTILRPLQDRSGNQTNQYGQRLVIYPSAVNGVAATS